MLRWVAKAAGGSLKRNGVSNETPFLFNKKPRLNRDGASIFFLSEN